MLERLQIQAIANKLAAKGQDDPHINPDDLNQPYRYIYTNISQGSVLGMGIEGALWHALRGIDGANALVNAIMDAIPTDSEYESLADLARNLEPIHWLWESWIPRGMLSLLGASPGAGKSLLALDLARRIIHDVPFPDGTSIPNPGTPVIYVDAEAIPQLQNDRALAWNMDRSRLYLMLPPETYGMIDFGDPTQQDRLIEMCLALQPDLIVIDSLSSISARGENNVEDVRSILGFLSAIAREFNAGLLLIHHLRKRSRTPLADLVTADDFRGSSHIIAMARSVLALSIIQDTPQPDRNGPRRLEIVKTNLCKYPPALGLILEPDDPRAPTLRYTDPPQPYREPTKTEQCAAWIIETLDQHGRPMKPKDLSEQAEEAGFKSGIFYRARKSIEGIVVDTEGRQSPNNLWALDEWKESDD